MTQNAEKLPFAETLLRYQPEVLGELPALAQTEPLCLISNQQINSAIGYNLIYSPFIVMRRLA